MVYLYRNMTVTSYYNCKILSFKTQGKFRHRKVDCPIRQSLGHLGDHSGAFGFQGAPFLDNQGAGNSPFPSLFRITAFILKGNDSVSGIGISIHEFFLSL